MNCPVCGADNMKTLMSRAIGAVTMRHRQCQDCSTEWWAQVQETIIPASVVPGKLEEVRQLPLVPNVPSPENVQPCTPVDISPAHDSSNRESKRKISECDEPANAHPALVT